MYSVNRIYSVNRYDKNQSCPPSISSHSRAQKCVQRAIVHGDIRFKGFLTTCYSSGAYVPRNVGIYKNLQIALHILRIPRLHKLSADWYAIWGFSDCIAQWSTVADHYSSSSNQLAIARIYMRAEATANCTV